MFRVLTVPEKSKAHTSEGDKDVQPPKAGGFRWIDLEDQDAETRFGQLTPYGPDGPQ